MPSYPLPSSVRFPVSIEEDPNVCDEGPEEGEDSAFPVEASDEAEADPVAEELSGVIVSAALPAQPVRSAAHRNALMILVFFIIIVLVFPVG